MPMESGYAAPEPAAETAPKAPVVAPTTTTGTSTSVTATGTAEATEATFREAALAKGVDTRAIDALVGIVGEKLGGDFKKGLATLNSKSAEELNAKYAPAAEDDSSQW